tara:strand:- start:69 stop:4220 length:4152 start_codon:yes stop_codon:yes gene_type:complete
MMEDDEFTLADDQTEAEKAQQFYDGSWYGELGEGIASGVIGIGEGVLGLGAIIADTIGDTDYGDQITQGAQDMRDAAGLDPEGIIGKGAEIITQFVVPGIGVAAKVGKAAKLARGKLIGPQMPLSKSQKFNLAAKELAAVTAAEFAVSGDGTTTIGDWVESGPTQSTDLIGLEGREKALSRLANRTRVAAEGFGIGGAAQGALSVVGKKIGDAELTKISAAAAKRKIDKTGRNIDELIEKRAMQKMGAGNDLTRFQGLLADGLAFARPRGFLPEQVAEKRLLLEGAIKPAVDKANRLLQRLDADTDRALANLPTGNGVLTKTNIMNKTLEFLTEPDRAAKARLIKGLPKEVRTPILKMRNHIDELSNDVLKTDFLKNNGFVTKSGQPIDEVIKDSLGSYIRRKYKIFEEKNYIPDAAALKAGNEFFTGNRKAALKQLTIAAKADIDDVFNDTFLLANGLTKKGAGDSLTLSLGSKGVTPALATKARDQFLSGYTIKKRKVMGTGRAAKDRLETGMFLSRSKYLDKPDGKKIRQLLGEIDDPRAAYLGTVADLAQFTAVDDYFSTVAKLAESNSGIGKFFRSAKNLTKEQEEALTSRDFVRLGGDSSKKGLGTTIESVSRSTDEMEAVISNSGWGSLNDYFVPRAVYNNLTSTIIGNDTFGNNLLRGAWGTALKAKGLSQYSKTVLSPITQVRNFVTALTFATANGNVPILGRGSSLKDSATAVFSNIMNKGDDAVLKDLADAQRRGILGTNAELREIQDSLNKGIGYESSTKQAPTNFVEAISGKTSQSKLAKGVGKVAKGFESMYQGSDDFWKYFNYNAEQAKLRNALNTVDLETQVKYLTKNFEDIDVNISSKLEPYKRGEVSIDDLVKRGDLDMDDLIKARSAQIVRDTVPNYNKGASELIQLGRKLPFGNFITFPAEMYRTGFNIVRQGLDDMASDIPAIASRGKGRMTGFITTTTVAPIAALELAYATSGVSREEMQAFKRSFAAPWQKGSVLIPTGKTAEGNIEYINYSTSNPYDVLSRFANRALSEADNAMVEGRDPGQAMVDIVSGTLGEAFAPFLDEAILTNAVVDIFYRGGRTETGAKIFNPQEHWATKGYKASAHIADTMIPNILRVADVTTGEPSRFIRGVLGDGLGIDAISSQDNMGRERTWKKELARLSTGFSTQEFEPKRGLRYAAYRLQQGQSDSKALFNKLTNDYNVTPESLAKGFEKANEAKYRNDRKYFRMIEDLRVMGMSDSEIRRTLKQNNVGGVKGILRGEFEPFKISKQNRKEMIKVGTYSLLPRDSINNIRDSFRNIPLDPTVEAEPVFTPVEAEPVFTPAEPTFVPKPPAQSPRLLKTSDKPSGFTPAGNLLDRAKQMGSSILGFNPANKEILDRQNQ